MKSTPALLLPSQGLVLAAGRKSAHSTTALPRLLATEPLQFQGHPSLCSSAVPNARASPLALVSPPLLVLSPTPALPLPLQAFLPHLPALTPSFVLLSVCCHSVMLVDTDLEPSMGPGSGMAHAGDHDRMCISPPAGGGSVCGEIKGSREQQRAEGQAPCPSRNREGGRLGTSPWHSQPLSSFVLPSAWSWSAPPSSLSLTSCSQMSPCSGGLVSVK